jgi:F-type H+-transporting ATPase subunit gamma
MATLKDIKRKIKSTKSIQKTTKAMQMISQARFARAQQKIISARPYSQKIEQLLFNLLKKTTTEHPFLKTGSVSNIGLLVITSEKGLCGGYNTNILRKTLEYIQSTPKTNFEIFVVGQKGRDFLKRNRITYTYEYFDVFKNLSEELMIFPEIIANEIIKVFIEKKLASFNIIYTEFKSLFSQTVMIKQLLPIEKKEVKELEFDYIYESDKEIIIDKLFNRYIKAQVYRILLEAYTSETAARRNAMQNATKNAEELIDDLTLYLNKLRQQQITKELIEIVSAGEV